jgi:sensor domain CHASE-containing protein/HPt (histidine-containing phosphotransfer) domain-containing protein
MIQRGLRTIYARLTGLIVPVPTPQDRKIKCRRRIVALATAAFLAALGIGGTFIALVERHQAEQQRRMVHDIGMRHASALQRHVDRALSSTLALATLLRRNGHIDDFALLAADMLRSYDGLSALTLAPQGIVQQVYPLEDHTDLLDFDRLGDPQHRTDALAAIAAPTLSLAGPFPLRTGGLGVVGRLPIFSQDNSGQEQFWGFIIAVRRLPELIETSDLYLLVHGGYDYELSRIHPDSGERHILARSSETPLQQATPFDVMVANGRWILAIVPHSGRQISSSLLINGLLVLFSSLLVGSLVYAQLYKNQKIRARRLSTLTRLNQLISSSLDMDAVLRKIAQAAATLMDVPFVRMWGADEATQTLSVRASSAAQSEVGRGSIFHFTARFGVQTGQIVQSEPPVDLTVLMGIVDGDKALMAELGEIFLQDYPVQMIELGKAIENGDAGQLERAAHSLKSALGSIGAKSAWRLAYELETMGRTTRLHEAASILQQLTAELERLTAFLADPSWVDRV